FEPPAPASRRQCSTRLSYSPTGTRFNCDLGSRREPRPRLDRRGWDEAQASSSLRAKLVGRGTMRSMVEGYPHRGQYPSTIESSFDGSPLRDWRARGNLAPQHAQPLRVAHELLARASGTGV